MGTYLSRNFSGHYDLIIQKSFLGRLSERIERNLGLTKTLFHINRGDDYRTGLLEFEKENPHWSGTQLPLIINITKKFYEKNGFNILECRETTSDYKNELLVIPEDYYKSFSMLVENYKRYHLSLTQGDRYSIWVIGSSLFNFGLK